MTDTTEEKMKMCMIAMHAIKALAPVGITLEELNEALATAGMRQLSDLNLVKLKLRRT
jgi:hypothetical protein